MKTLPTPDNQIIKRLVICLAICLAALNCYAQKPLTNSRQSSFYTYIYRLKPTDVLNFYLHPGKDPDQKILQTPVDSFKTDKYWENTLPPGNYMKVFAEKNKLKYNLIENHSAFLKLMSNDYDLSFTFLSKDGHLIDNASATINDKPVPYDAKRGLYHSNYSKGDTLLRADYKGVVNYFLIKAELRNYYNRLKWYEVTWAHIKNIFKKPGNRQFRYHPMFQQNYTGFMVFNKPKYKPRDTVRFKAFILEKNSKKPIETHSLAVRLMNGSTSKTIGTVNSYRDGGFEYSFVLTDSLKLILDNNYTIGLEDPADFSKKKKNANDDDRPDAKQRVFITGAFRYEDYELKSTVFKMRADKDEQWRGSPYAVYFKATDENDLPVPDGRVKLTITTQNITQYQNSQVFVPDTLWTHQLPLEPVGETKLIIPDSIFPTAGITYRIEADFLNSANEEKSDGKNVTYHPGEFNIITKLNRDTLIATSERFGKAYNTAAVISALDDKDDTLSKVKVQLPYKMLINPNIHSYDIEADNADNETELKNEESGITLSGYRTADSVLVKVGNDRNLHFSYLVFIGDKLADEGQADNLNYRKAYPGDKLITFMVNYIWAGESRTEKTVIFHADNTLNINVKQPLSVYPGQRVQTDIVVTDVNGKPVANTDITAWSLTKKFNNYMAPNAPYLGKAYPYRKTKAPFEISDNSVDGYLTLNWDRWAHSMGLDSIVYFNFTHPKTVYSIEEPTADTITQIAPFVVKNGNILPVHILYIDNRPVYFSQAQQLQKYSFAVSPGLHTLRFRTATQGILLDTVRVAKSKKLIISINVDTLLNKRITIRKASDTLDTYEADLVNKYMVTVVNNFGWKMALLQQGGQNIILNPHVNGYNEYGGILAGPLADNYAVLSVTGQKPALFLTEPQYSYQFEPGLIKQKSIPTKYPFSKLLTDEAGMDDYRQYVLTKTAADSLWQQYLDLRSNVQNLFINKPAEKNAGGLTIEISGDKNYKTPFVKNIIVYRYDDPDYIAIYPGNTTSFGKLEKGKYRLLFLLKNDKYDIAENLVIKPYGLNFYRLAVKPSHAKDSVSIKITSIINHREGLFSGTDSSIENDALRLKEAFNDSYFDESVFGDNMAGVVIGGDDNLPVVGCSVRIKGTNNGTNTNIGGRFKLRVPKTGKLLVSYIGYQTQEVSIGSGKTVKVKLIPASSALNEVVVTGYTSQRKRDVGNSMSLLQGQAAGVTVINSNAPGGGDKIFIRGLASAGIPKPLMIVDGQIEDSIDGIDASSILEISVLKDAAATALYGARAANGVVIITTKKKNEDQNTSNAVQPGGQDLLRKNFSDYAYWQPKLTTDADGKASFVSTFPDDITNWRTFVMAVNGQKQSGMAEHQIKSFRPLSASFISPLFAVEGDELSAIGKIANYNNDAAKLTRTFTYNGKVIKQDVLEVKNSKIDTLNITAAETDSLAFEYSLKRDNGYFDGELRKIPVIERGVKETKGSFEALNADTAINMTFDAALGPVTLRAEASVLPALLEEAQHLREYKYLCNEQLASKLKGLLVEKRIDTYLGQPFKWEKNVLDIIKKLQENRGRQGIWGWWKDTDEELWISLHVVEALTDAKRAGYLVSIDTQKLTDYLVYQLESYKSADKLTCLQLLHQLQAKVDYSKYVGLIAIKLGNEQNVPAYDKLRLMLLRQDAGLPVKLDSLLTSEHHTLFGNIYWGEDSYRFFDNSIQLSLLAYKIIKNEGKHPEILTKIRGYLLEQKRNGDWRNTYESSLILETILPDLLNSGNSVKPQVLTIKGAKTDTISKFPYSATITDKQLHITKTGSLPVYITAYQQFWNPNPEKVNKEFTVDTWFEKKGAKLTKLTGGEQVTLKAEVNVKGDADYVMVEIPIPAGCSYQSKEQAYTNNEVHREYFKEKVSIFCRKLKQGKYTFNITLMPRYSGKYNLNPTKAEMMYFPVFYGREGMKKVVIGD